MCHEVLFYNQGTLVSRHTTKASVNCLLWSSRESHQGQLLLAGQEDGRIAVLRVKGAYHIQVETIWFLLFHKSPVLFL